MKYYQLVLVVLNVCLVHGFNLEPRIPVIKKGLSGSYFGYSVAEHQEIPDDDKGRPKSWYVLFDIFIAITKKIYTIKITKRICTIIMIEYHMIYYCCIMLIFY